MKVQFNLTRHVCPYLINLDLGHTQKTGSSCIRNSEGGAFGGQEGTGRINNKQKRRGRVGQREK